MAEHISPRLEMELARTLEPAPVPEALWDRIQDRVGEAPAPRRTRAFRWDLWPVAAALLLMAAAELVWQSTDMEKLAARELQGRGSLDIRSDDPAEIQGWLKSKANIDIDLLHGVGVQLVGARLIPRWGTPVAAIAYRVGDDDATLLVSRKLGLFSGTAASKHVFSKIESTARLRLISWRASEQVYTIASSRTKDLQAPCMLCHMHTMTTLN